MLADIKERESVVLYSTVQCTVHSTATLTAAGESKREENRSESGPGGTTQCLMIF